MKGASTTIPSKAIIVPDLAYTSPQGRRGIALGGQRELIEKLRYFQYRDDANGHIPQRRGIERWQDRGLGTNFRTILNACAATASEKVLAWTWVISPDPEVFTTVPDHERAALLTALTDSIVAEYYESRGMQIPPYAFVMHDRLSTAKDAAGTPLHQLHTHVVLPGTAQTPEGTLVPFYNNANKGHVQLLRDIATDNLSRALDQSIGTAWRALRPEITPPTQPEPEVVELPPPERLPRSLQNWLNHGPTREREREIR